MAPPLPKEQAAAGPGTAASSASLSAVLVNAMIVTAHEMASNPAFPILRRGPAPPAAARHALTRARVARRRHKAPSVATVIAGRRWPHTSARHVKSAIREAHAMIE